MGKDNHRAPNFKVPIPYFPEDEKEADPSDGKAPSVKLLLDSARGPEPKLPTRGANSRQTSSFGSTRLMRNR
jgi:hypothetical protein